MTNLTELRAEWVRQQREPVDQFWVGPAPFVERLFGIIEEQQQSIQRLRAALAPMLPFPPQHGFLQAERARKIWQASESWSAARPS